MKNQFSFALTIAIVFVLFTNKTNAQKSYIRFGVGYGWPLAPNYTSTDVNKTIGNTQVVNATIVQGSGSLGKGIQFDMGFGHGLNKHITGELHLSYLLGAKIKHTYVEYVNVYSNSHEEILQGKMLRIIPSVKFSTDIGKSKIYFRSGLIFCTAKRILISEYNVEERPSSVVVSEFVRKLTGNSSYGLTSAIGSWFMVNKKITFYAEINAVAQSWAPSEADLIKYEENGIDKLSDLKPKQKKTLFVDHLYSTSHSTKFWPYKKLKEYWPFSSVGINVGIALSFGKNH